ncbi:hypothetical protein FOA52_010757 [Chlamydomonas sp. UWO 241]|nr:hypothetical protein FOA52_010757 [Chlamydomonas sp. UWO 241]
MMQKFEDAASDLHALAPLSVLTTHEGWAPGSEALQRERESGIGGDGDGDGGGGGGGGGGGSGRQGAQVRGGEEGVDGEDEEGDEDGEQIVWAGGRQRGAEALGGGSGGGGGGGGEAGARGMHEAHGGARDPETAGVAGVGALLARRLGLQQDGAGFGARRGGSGPGGGPAGGGDGGPFGALLHVEAVLGGGERGGFIGELLADVSPEGAARARVPLPPPRADGGDDTAARSAIGAWGEAFVYEYLADQMRDAAGGMALRWLNEHEEQGRPYDIVLETRADGDSGGVHTTYIEVKASALSDKALFEFSHNEFLFAQQAGDDYHIYRVLSAGRADARIVRIVNPYLQFRTQRIGLCITL